MICVYQLSYRLLTHLVCICVEACPFSTEYVYIHHTCVYICMSKKKNNQKTKGICIDQGICIQLLYIHIYIYMHTHTKQKNCSLWQFHQGKHAYCVHVCVYVNIQEYLLKHVIYTHTEYIGIFILVAKG